MIAFIFDLSLAWGLGEHIWNDTWWFEFHTSIKLQSWKVVWVLSLSYLL